MKIQLTQAELIAAVEHHLTSVEGMNRKVQNVAFTATRNEGTIADIELAPIAAVEKLAAPVVQAVSAVATATEAPEVPVEDSTVSEEEAVSPDAGEEEVPDGNKSLFG